MNLVLEIFIYVDRYYSRSKISQKKIRINYDRTSFIDTLLFSTNFYSTYE